MPDPMRSAPRLDPADRPADRTDARALSDHHPWSDGRPRSWNRAETSTEETR